MPTLCGTMLDHWATQSAAPPALLMPERAIGYAELRDRVETCAAWLVAEGSRPGEVTGITVADELANLVVTLALLRLDVPQVCLPSTEPPAVRMDLARRLAVVRIVAGDPLQALAECPASIVEPASIAPAARLAAHEAAATDPDAMAIYFTSSGTTGRPKIIPVSHRLLARRAEVRNFAPSERLLLPSSVEDYLARSARLHCLYRGLTSVFLPRPPAPAADIRALCARTGVTRIDVSVLQAAGLLTEGLPASTVKVFVSGARVPVALRNAYRAGGSELYVEYGARECSGISSTFPSDPDDSLETVGAPYRTFDLEIADEAGKSLPPGEIGELRIRSSCTIAGYFDDPAADARHFRHGWFYPGDLASLTRHGSLRIHGRADDMMNLNGIKIFPAEIEHMLESDPSVRAAAAFAIPSAIHGDIPVAAVELRDPTAQAVAALMARGRELLGARAPRKIFVVDALPRNAAGKVRKQALAKLLARPR